MIFLDYLSPIERYIEYLDDKIKAKRLHRKVIYTYGRIQEADLYAHFSPVGLINHKKVLSDFTEYCNDSIGVTSSIWDRIKKVGEDRFYRVEYPKKQNGSELSFDDKRNEDKKYVNEEGSTFLLNTSIADSDYVRSVIETFVNKNKAFEEKLYHEKK